MRITRISIDGLRCYRRRRDFEFSLDRVNVLHGPNGAGKSSLLAALHHAFLTNHNSTQAEVAALVPWGTSLAPDVEAEFSAGGNAFRLHKRFVHQPSCILERQDVGAWHPVAKGKEADAMLRQTLGAPADGTATKDRLLASVLWAQQGAMALTGVSPNVHSALAVQLDSSAAQNLRKWIETKAATYLTPTGRRQKYSPAALLETEHSDLLGLRSKLGGELQAIEALRDELLGLETASAAEAAEVARLEAELGRLQKDDAEAARLRQQLLSMKPLADMKRQAVDSVAAAIKTCEQALQTISTTCPQLAALEAEAGPDLDRALAGAEANLKQANDDHVAALAFTALLNELAAVTKRIETVRHLQAAIGGLEGELRGLNAPTAVQVKRMQDLDKSLAELRAALDSALLHLKAMGERPVPIEILEGDQPGTHTLEPDTPLRFSASPRMRFRIPGVGEFEISGPAGSAGELRQKIGQQETEQRELATLLGTPDLAELQRRLSRAVEIEADLAAGRKSLAQELAGKMESEWQKESIRLGVGLEGHYLTRPHWRTGPPDADAINASLGPLRQLRDKLAGLNAGIANLKQTLAAAQTKLADTLAQQSADSIEALRERESAQRTELAGLSDQMKTIEGQLAAYPPGLAAAAADCAAGLSQAKQRLDESRKSLQTKSGQLSEKLSGGPASNLGDVESKIVALEPRLQRERMEESAWRLLRDEAAAARESMLKQVSEPAAVRATEILKRIGASHLGGVRLDAELVPAPLSPEGAASPVGLDVISGGEAEQVHFAARLALAEMLATEEPQLAVFDDVLLSSDDTRLGRMLALLEESGLQVLILTCHPERYEGRLNSPLMIPALAD